MGRQPAAVQKLEVTLVARVAPYLDFRLKRCSSPDPQLPKRQTQGPATAPNRLPGPFYWKFPIISLYFRDPKFSGVGWSGLLPIG